MSFTFRLNLGQGTARGAATAQLPTRSPQLTCVRARGRRPGLHAKAPQPPPWRFEHHGFDGTPAHGLGMDFRLLGSGCMTIFETRG
jgi:hypothetical protein